MITFTDNDSLCRFVPNVAVTVDGEATLFEKIYPWLEMVETDLFDSVIGDVSLKDKNRRKIFLLSQFIVANKALAIAIPSLDLVFTPNGFGVVNTTNLAPASKERVERLMSKCLETTNRSIDMLITALADIPEWVRSKQGKFFTSTTLTFPYQSAKVCNTGSTDIMAEFKNLMTKATAIENEFAEKWISAEVLDRLRVALIDNTDNYATEKNLGLMVRSLVIREIIGEQRDFNALRYIVNQIRNSSLFPEWQMSDTAKAYFVDPFKNDKQKGGYWL